MFDFAAIVQSIIQLLTGQISGLLTGWLNGLFG